MKVGTDRSVRNDRGVIYFVQGERSGMVKIGHTQSLKSRLRTLQIGAPERLRVLAVMDGDAEVERQLHERFADARANGEWFHPRLDLLRLAERASRDPTIHPALARRSARGRRAKAASERRRLEPIRVAADLQGITVRDWFLRFALPMLTEIAQEQIAASESVRPDP